MELKINGELRDVSDGIAVSKLLKELSVVPERVVVEVNLAILKRNQHATTTLKEGDEVEIVQAVGGGAFTSSRLEARGKNPCLEPRT